MFVRFWSKVRSIEVLEAASDGLLRSLLSVQGQGLGRTRGPW